MTVSVPSLVHFFFSDSDAGLTTQLGATTKNGSAPRWAHLLAATVPLQVEERVVQIQKVQKKFKKRFDSTLKK